MLRFWGIFFLLLSLQAHAQRGGEVITIDDSVGNSYALVVGISTYLNINPLMYADDDAELFAGFLIEEGICERRNVVRLIDSQATATNFYFELEKLLNKTKPKDRLFIYFAGHGDVENKIQAGFLLCYGTRPSPYPGSDVIDIDMLEKYVNAFTQNNTKVILISDACRSGNLAGGLAGAANTITAMNSRFRNVIKMLSCQPNQLSLEKTYPNGGHGVFTYHLVNGLYGLADKDADGIVTLRELDFYLEEVRNETNKKQTPRFDGDPDARLVKYDQALKKIAALRKTSSPAVAVNNKTRGGEDSTWINNKHYKQFVQALKEKALVTYDMYDAISLIKRAEIAGEPAAMITDMKLELGAVLEDELQKWINRYLRGEYDPKRNCFDCIVQMNDYAKALEELTPKDHFRYAEIHLKRVFFDVYHNWSYEKYEDYPRYIAGLLKASEKVPHQAWIYQVIGALYSDLHNEKKALEYLNMAIALAPRWSYPQIDLGIIALDKKDLKKAKEHFEKALSFDSTMVLSWYNIGVTYDHMHRFDEAEKYYLKALEVNPDYTRAAVTLGNMYYTISRFDEAEKCYRFALNKDSASGINWSNLGKIEARKNHYDKAEEYFRAGMKQNYDYAEAVLEYGKYLYTKKRYTEAEEKFREAVKEDPHNHYAKYRLGDNFIKRNLYDSAEITFKTLLKEEPGYHLGWAGLGDLYAAKDDLKNAERNYQKALKIDSLDPYTWSSLGSLYIDKYDTASALRSLRKSLAIDSSDTWVINNYAFLLSQMGKKQEAEKYFKKTLLLEPDNAYALFTLGQIETGKQNSRAAARYFVEAIQSDPQTYAKKLNTMRWLELAEEGVFEISDSLLAAGNKQEALTYAEAAYWIDTTDTYFNFKLARIHASMNHSEQAMGFLNVAIEKASSELLNNIEKDPWLISLTNNKEFIDRISRRRAALNK